MSYEAMNEQRAREILGRRIQADNSLMDPSDYVAWPSASGGDVVCLDANFSADDLEAIAWWMRNKVVTRRA